MIQRAQRAVRLAGFSQTSRLARPPAVLEEPDIRPSPGGFRIAFTKYPAALFSDIFTEAVVTEEGAVNVYRNGLGGLSKFAPICGESRFTAVAITGTGSGAALYNAENVQPYCEFPYFYASRQSPIRTIWKVDLTSGALTQATTTPGSGAATYQGITSRPEIDWADALRGTTALSAETRDWIKTLEPSASTSQNYAMPAPYDFSHFHIDENWDYWHGGDGGWVFKSDITGSIYWSEQLPVDSITTDYVAGLWVVDGVGGIAFTEQTDGQFDFFLIDSATGTPTDVTAFVTIDGVPWDTVAPGIFGAPNVVTTQWGNRIGFRKGTDFYIGTVTT